MTDEVWKRPEPESPCVKICVIEPASGFCLGCHRTIREISDWSRMSADERHAVLDRLHQRAEAAKPARRGGRRARLKSRDG